MNKDENIRQLALAGLCAAMSAGCFWISNAYPDTVFGFMSTFGYLMLVATVVGISTTVIDIIGSIITAKRKHFMRENIVYIPHIIELVDGKYMEVKAVSSRKAMTVYGRLKSTLRHDKTLVLGDIVVEKPYRNRGVGTRLLNELISLAEKEGVKEITGNLSTVDDCETLIHFYSKLGFEIRTLETPDGNNTFATIHKYL